VKTLISLIVGVVLTAGSGVATSAGLIKAFNQFLGWSKADFLAGWGKPTLAGTDLVVYERTRTHYIRGTPATSETSESGRIDSKGNWNSSSVTTSEAGRPERAFSATDRYVFYFDSVGVCYRWEIQNFFGNWDSQHSMIWTVVEARERVTKNGKAKIMRRESS
jgi:hypothetical protein